MVCSCSTSHDEVFRLRKYVASVEIVFILKYVWGSIQNGEIIESNYFQAGKDFWTNTCVFHCGTIKNVNIFLSHKILLVGGDCHHVGCYNFILKNIFKTLTCQKN